MYHVSMQTKSLILIAALLVVVVGVASFFIQEKSTAINSQDAAANAVIAHYPGLAAYRTTSLPPSSIEGQQATDGWNVAFVQRGSGLPGILTARCFHVTTEGAVAESGTYARGSGQAVERVDLGSCIPEVVSEPVKAVTPYGTVTLRIGELATFKDVSIKPMALVEDSRCPVGVQCIQAGTVRLKLEVTTATADTSIVSLGQVFTTKGMSITLTAANPAKHPQVETMPSEYQFTFTVVPQNVPVVTNPQGKCYVGGCSAQLCSDAPDMASTCEYTAAYACYKTATCERQQNGQCGWTSTTELRACLATNQ